MPIAVFANQNAPMGILEPSNEELVGHLIDVFGAKDTPYIYQLILCESGGKTSARHLNDNGTTDFNLLQVNSLHLPEASKLNLDLVYNWKDNLLMGKMILDQQGFGAWLVCSAKLGITSPPTA